MTGALDAVRAGDRAALRGLLLRHGAAVDAALRALGAADDDAWRAAAVAVWRESISLVRMPGESAPDDDERHERGFVLACALAAAALPLLEGTSLDKRVAARLAARTAAGVATDAEAKLHRGQLEEAPDPLAAVVARLAQAVATSSAAAAGAGPVERLWPSVEPLLR